MQSRNRRGLALVLATAAAAVVQVGAQQAPATVRTFDAASVRANKSGTTQQSINRSETGVTIVNFQLRTIIQLAYGISQPTRFVGMPDWANAERFDITARGRIGGLDDFRVLMQALLADRFRLAAHPEQRNMPMHSLVLARSDGRLGPSLKPSACPPLGLGAITGRGGAAPGASAPSGDTPKDCGLRGSGPGEINLGGIDIGTFAAFLSLTQGRPVVDNTKLAGAYDIHFLFAPDPFPGQAPNPVTEGRPSLLTALQEQLGLKLVPGVQPQDVLVIDRLERPDDN
jgi:uncharacterized protein (TIGR03435 family)